MSELIITIHLPHFVVVGFFYAVGVFFTNHFEKCATKKVSGIFGGLKYIKEL